MSVTDFIGQSILLAQVRLGTTPTEIFTAMGGSVEITRLHVVATAGTPTFRLFHDDTGTGPFDESTALAWDAPVTGTPTIFQAEAENSGISLTANGRVYGQASAANAVTVTAYGVVTTQRA